MAASSDDKNLALYCDFENIALGVRDAKYQKFDISHILERLLVKGSIVVKKAYCDWDRYKNFKGPMHEAAFELIEIPHVRMSGKNSADIRMVVDALDLCYTKSHVDTFVIISGDSDFSPLVSKLRENAKTVIGVGVKNSTSDLLISSCDEFIYYDDLVREIERTRSPTSRKRSGRKRSSRSTRTEAKVEERDEREAPRASSPSPAESAAWSSRPAADRDDEGAGAAGEVTMTLEEAARSRASGSAAGEGADEAASSDADSRESGAEGGEEEGGSGARAAKTGGRRRSRARRAAAPESESESVDAEEGDRPGDSETGEASADVSADAAAETALDEAHGEALDETDGEAAAEPSEEGDETGVAPRSKKKTAKRASRKKAATKKAAAKKSAAKKKASKKVAGTTSDAAVPAADPVSALPKDESTLEDDDADSDDDDLDDGEESASETPDELAREGLDIVLETALALTSERGGDDKLWGSMVKQTLKRRRPGFNESYYGFESFGKMLEEAEARGFLSLEHDDRSGGYIITDIRA